MPAFSSLTIFFFCISIANLSAQAPIITSFSPASGPVGTPVIITGSGFNSTAANNIVVFGATKAIVSAATTTRLSVMVPSGATYQKITVTNLSVNLTAYSAKPFSVTFEGSINFASKIDQVVGTQPVAISSADLDDDGKPDLAVASLNDWVISVLRNTSLTGNLSFAAKVDLPTGSQPRSVRIGDINGDGKPDLVITNGGSLISVFRNTSTPGSLSFATKQVFTIGSSAFDVSIGDLDNDGKADLAVTNSLTNSLSILRNTSSSGIISFAPKVDFITGASPRSVSISDIDGDNKPDVVVVNYRSSTTSVFRNISTTGFVNLTAKLDFSTGINPENCNLGDIDGDGRIDLVVPNMVSNSFSVFRNISATGNISFASKIDFPTGAGPNAVNFGDVDGDGRPDLSVPNLYSNVVSIFRNTSVAGTVSLALKNDVTVATGPWSVSVGDMDGDGKTDLTSVNNSSASVSVLRQVVPVHFAAL